MENIAVYNPHSTARYVLEIAVGLLSLALAFTACSAPMTQAVEAPDLGGVGDAAQRDMTPVNVPDLALVGDAAQAGDAAQPPAPDMAKAPTCGVAGLPCCSVSTGSGCDSTSACMMSQGAPQTFECVPTTNSKDTCAAACAAAFAPSQTAQIAACNAACVGPCGAFHEATCEYDGSAWCGWCDPQTTSCPLFSSTGAGFMETGSQGCGSGPKLVQP